jgi:hypothetical protein
MVTNRGDQVPAKTAVGSVFPYARRCDQHTSENYQPRRAPRCRKCVNQLISRLEYEVFENFIGRQLHQAISFPFLFWTSHHHLLSFSEAELDVVHVDWLRGQFGLLSYDSSGQGALITRCPWFGPKHDPCISPYRRRSQEDVITRFPLPRTIEIGRRVEESSLAKMCDGDAVEDMKHGVWHVLRIWRLGCRREGVKKLRGKYEHTGHPRVR